MTTTIPSRASSLNSYLFQYSLSSNFRIHFISSLQYENINQDAIFIGTPKNYVLKDLRKRHSSAQDKKKVMSLRRLKKQSLS